MTQPAKKVTYVNHFWMLFIVSECALCYATGLVNRHGSPFAQFRAKFPDCPRNRAQAMHYIFMLCNANGIKLSAYFLKVYATVPKS